MAQDIKETGNKPELYVLTVSAAVDDKCLHSFTHHVQTKDLPLERIKSPEGETSFAFRRVNALRSGSGSAWHQANPTRKKGRTNRPTFSILPLLSFSPSRLSVTQRRSGGLQWIIMMMTNIQRNFFQEAELELRKLRRKGPAIKVSVQPREVIARLDGAETQSKQVTERSKVVRVEGKSWNHKSQVPIKTSVWC